MKDRRIILGRIRSVGDSVWDGGEEFSIVPVVYPRGTVSVSSLGSFSAVIYSSKPSHHFFTFYIRAYHIQEYLNKKRGRKRKCINPQQ